MKLSRRELTVLRIVPDINGYITPTMIRNAGVKATAVAERLAGKKLLRRDWLSDGAAWTVTDRGRAILRMLDERKPCDWCGIRASDYCRVKGSATTVFFCDDHERVGRESAEGASSAIGGKNVAQEVFGLRTSNKALRAVAAK